MNTIEETIKLAGFGRKKAMKNQIELFEKELFEDEKLLGVGTSTPNPTEQLYITNKRIIVHKIVGVFKNKRIEVPLDSIGSTNMILKGLGASIEIIASNNKAIVEKMHIHIAQEIKKIIDSLILSPKIVETTKAASYDITDQIKKLADLRDNGVITEEEFSVKKKQLLNI